MPLGNGDISVMAWAEENGDLLLYVGKCDSWDENGRLLKLGRLRLHFSHNPFAAGQPFRQTLHADRAEIEIVTGGSQRESRIRLWVDAQPAGGPHRNGIGSGVRTGNASGSLAHCGTRTGGRRRLLPDRQAVEGRTYEGHAGHDSRCSRLSGLVSRNERSVWTGTLKYQGIGELISKFQDPLLALTSGALVRGNDLRVVDRTTLRSAAPSKRFVVSVHPRAAQTASAEDWLVGLRKQAEASDQVALDQACATTVPGGIVLAAKSPRCFGLAGSGAGGAGLQPPEVSAGVASRGRFPMKFNGSLFTVDGTRAAAQAGATIPEVYDADFRLWGGGYWFQNCRLLYWPMLMAGDFDLMPPFFRMYQEALPLAEARTRIYFKHGGAFFPETMAFWGTYLNENYGYDRTGKTIPSSDVIASVRGQTQRDPLQPGEVANTYIRRYWQGGIELLAMMLDYHALTQDERFANDTLLPLARPILTFYREHYPHRDEHGKIVFAPAQAIETWQVAVNPLPEIAGLHWVTDGLLCTAGPRNTSRPATARCCWRTGLFRYTDRAALLGRQYYALVLISDEGHQLAGLCNGDRAAAAAEVKRREDCLPLGNLPGINVTGGRRASPGSRSSTRTRSRSGT